MRETVQKLVNSIVFDKYREHARKVIKQIKALPDSCRQSGDDSDLKDVWEEFKFQLHNGESIFYFAYEITIRQMCDAVVFSLPQNEMRLLWLWSDGYVEWDEEDEHDPPYSVDDVATQLYKTVCEIGDEEPLAMDTAEDEEEDDE